LVIEAHAAEDDSFLEQYQKGNPEKRIIYRSKNSVFRVREREYFLVLYSAAEGDYACSYYLSSKFNMRLKTSFILTSVSLNISLRNQ
jgi:hypothetical protein